MRWVVLSFLGALVSGCHRVPWRVDTLGTVHVRWSTGYMGFLLSLGAEHAGVRSGQVEAWTDNLTSPPTPLPRADVTARRASCNSIGL